MRRVISFNKDWYFTKDSAADVAAILGRGEAVTLPHTWNAVDGQDGGNDYYRGTCLYAKTFAAPELSGGERLYIEFEGAAMTATVTVNGTEVARHEDGFSTFRADITDLMKAENNTIIVSVDNGANDRIYPQKADFTFYGGLYRDVNLLITPAEHFEAVKDGTPGIKVTPIVNADDRSAVLTLEGWLNADREVTFEVYAPAGMGHAFWDELRKKTGDGCDALEAAAIGGTLVTKVRAKAADGYVKAETMLQDITLWDGVHAPYLYVVKASAGEDTVFTRIGFRSFKVKPDEGFFLNGASYPLRGVSRHQDRKGVGNALTPAMHEEDLGIILDIGANTVRLAHYQQAQYFYDLCDEAGLVVWAEIPYITQHMPNGRENTLLQMLELVTQCYHHASIVCWGLSNEITASGTVTEDLLENHRLLNDLCHKLDTTRPTTMAHVFMLETDSPLIEIADIGSYNLYYGWYLGELTENDESFDTYRRAHPDRVIGFSEYGADANPQYQSEAPERGDYTESYQCVYHEHLLRCIEERPYLWATHVWNLFDFGADGRDEGGKHGENQKGLVTIDRALKKDAYYLYKAHWSADPFVHLCGRRFAERIGVVTQVKVYSNQNTVALFVDGQEVASQSGQHVFTFKLALDGEMKIEARAVTKDGVTVSDEMTIQKALEANPDYRMQSQQAVVNWFDKEDLKEGYFSIEDTLGEISADPAGAALIKRMMDKARASRGDVAASTEGNATLQKMLAKMKVSALLKQAGDAISPDEVRALNQALQSIKKPQAKVRVMLSADSRLEEIFRFEEGCAVFDKFLPGMRKMVEEQKATLGFTLKKLVMFSQGRISEQVVAQMDAALSALEIYTNAKEDYTEDFPLTAGAKEQGSVDSQKAIYPGKPWFDTDGKRIQAHGGAVYYEDGVYYWYGENKDRTDGECAVWTWGIRVYSSTDLCNWKDLGYLIAPDLADEKSCMYPEKHIDRPHIVKSGEGKYVCWIKHSGEEACFSIWEADALLGPYQLVKEGYRPFDYKVGDFDLVQDGDETYLFMDADHTGIVGMRLKKDLHEADQIVSKQYEDLHAPFCREAVALFCHGKKWHMLTSGMSGYTPNRSDDAVADAITDSFTSVGDPHVDDTSRASFNSQIAQVFKVQGKKDLYVAIADRWVPDYPVDAALADIIERSIAAHYEPDKYHVTKEEQERFMAGPMLESTNTSIADYVWLPITFDGDRAQIVWRDAWSPEDFA